MPSFTDSIFLFALALLLFGPKRLPVLARELGKWVGEFRRASNEFKMQMEEELRLVEQADRKKQIAAIEAAAPIPAPIEQPEHPHLPTTESASATETESDPYSDTRNFEPDQNGVSGQLAGNGTAASNLHPGVSTESAGAPPTASRVSETTGPAAVLPIASSGELNLMPPASGLPTPRRSATPATSDPLGGLLDAIPEARHESEAAEASSPEIAHGQ